MKNFILSNELLNNRYKIKRELGRNAGRRTFLAQDLQTQELLVIKLLIFNENFRWDDLKLFEREVETLKSLSHPSIPQYIDYFSVDTPNLKAFAHTQTYINAQSLQEYLVGGRTFSETEVKQLAKSLLSVLDYLHSHQPPVIHRDIKPSNILLADRSAHHIGSVYLVDFGSVQTRSAQDGTMTIVGTYGYMAPEQFVGRVSFASDLYSLGATLIHLVTGVEPVDLQFVDLQIQFEEAANISSTFKDWLKLMTHPSLKKRFDSVQSALTGLTGELTIKKPPLSNIILTKAASHIDITIPYRQYSSTRKAYLQVINNLKKDYQPTWASKIFDIITLRGLWSWLILISCSLLVLLPVIGIPISLLWAFLFVFPEFIRNSLLFVSVGAIVIRLLSPKTSSNIKSFYQALIPDEKPILHQDLKHLDALNVNINQESITIRFTYTSIFQSKETYTILKKPTQSISKIIFEKKSYKLVETGTDDHGNKTTEQKEVPPSLYLWVANKRYGLNYKLTTPELYWLAEELSYFLDIPINWE
ncbi:serine/threonine protein kinase [Calothrix sp. NIES-4071]|nr:serine/threonine protein kinase [Calothrix sp. NIES-4071]BAZ62111.1 serine/threonine protein kinase [Calothrix sp. NIES-4105]